MRRSAKDRRERPAGLGKVERIHLSWDHAGLRFAAFAVCLALGIGGIGYGIYSLVSTKPGWTQVEIAADSANCGGDFTLSYLVTGANGDPTGELRGVSKAYSDACVRGYRLFTPWEEFEDMHNLCYINAHPNEDITVEAELYQALSLADGLGDRTVYLGPLHSLYADLFSCVDDVLTADFDPYEDSSTAEFYRQWADFARNPEHIQLRFLGENTLRLEVSEEYRSFARGEQRECYLDFGWQKNAFLADFLMEAVEGLGAGQAQLMSYDGFVRTAGGGPGRSLGVYDWTGERVIEAARAVLDGPVNAASLRPFPLGERDMDRTYVYEDGRVRHAYIDLQDGFCRTPDGSLTVYSSEKSCGELAVAAGKAFIGKEPDLEALSSLSQSGIDSLLVWDKTVWYTEDGLEIGSLYENQGLRYEARQL